MRTDAAVTTDADLVALLLDSRERLPDPVREQILRRGPAVIPALVEVLEDDELAQSDAEGGGHAPIHAAAILGELKAGEAIEPMLRVLGRCDGMDSLYSALIHALKSLGGAVLEPALAAHAAAASEDQRAAVAEILASLHVRDDRILPILLGVLEDQPELGASLLAEYGDEAALPRLSAALDGCELDPRGRLLVNQDVVELEAAIRDLGGALTEEQERKVRASEDAREEARAPLLAIGRSEDGDEEVPAESKRERDEVIARFSESPHARGALDLDWIELSLQYGAEYQGVSFSAFRAQVLRQVIFELFPRKVSCEPSAAPEIVRSLRAFWTFAKEVLAHPHAEACLRELGDEAIPRLARRMADPSNFGMAKSLVMMGRRRGFDVESEAGLRKWFAAYNLEQSAPGAVRPSSSRGQDQGGRKKKLRKLRKKAQRRNRR